MREQIDHIAGKEYFVEQINSKPKPGRRPFLSDEELFARRNQLAAHFVNEWPEVGGELWGARTAPEINRIFAALENRLPQDLLRPFRIPSNATYVDLTRNRHRVDELRACARHEYQVSNELVQFRDRIASALKGDRIKGHLEIESTYLRVARDCDEHRREFERLGKGIEELRNKIELQEAAFAQTELLRCIKERRYSWTPVSLANCMAGLGHMAYRQSASRCSKKVSNAETALRYEVFRAIEFLCRQASPRSLLIDLDERVLNLPHRYRSAQAELKQKFYFLRTALEESAKDRLYGRKYVFAVARAYSRWLYSSSLLDDVRAYNQQL